MSRRMLIVAVLVVAPLISAPVMPAVQHAVAGAAPAVHLACGGGMSQGSDSC